MKTTATYYRVNPSDISYLRFIFEACDGIAVVSTMDACQGIIALITAPGCEPETSEVLQRLQKEILMEKVDFHPPEGYELAP